MASSVRLVAALVALVAMLFAGPCAGLVISSGSGRFRNLCSVAINVRFTATAAAGLVAVDATEATIAPNELKSIPMNALGAASEVKFVSVALLKPGNVATPPDVYVFRLDDLFNAVANGVTTVIDVNFEVKEGCGGDSKKVELSAPSANLVCGFGVGCFTVPVSNRPLCVSKS